MTTAKKLTDKYNLDLEQLQSTCKHEDVSDWLIVREMHGNDTGVRLKQCKTCWKILSRKTKCEACGEEFTYNMRDWTRAQLCSECSKKGKFYCWEHKQFHNEPQGCPECLEFEGT